MTKRFKYSQWCILVFESDDVHDSCCGEEMFLNRVCRCILSKYEGGKGVDTGFLLSGTGTI